ncbi:MAG: histidine kinase dimerization/phospho-acceptor domain-containing protein [Litorimonas sp.]
MSTDALVVGGIASIAMIIFTIISGASFGNLLIIFLSSVAAIWLYVRILRPTNSTPKPRLSLQDMPEIRGQMIEGIADALPRAIVVLNRNADVIYANEASFKMLSPDIIGKPIGAYLRTSSVRPHMEQAFQGETPPSLSVHVLQPTERYIDVDFSQAIAIDTDDKRSAVVLAVLADRTQSRIDREQRVDFLANASHELKTPIASMTGIIETLRGHAKDDPVAREKFLKIMAEQADRMERLVTDLLSLRRIESSEHIAPSATADLRKALEAARDSLTLLADKKDITMSITLPAEKTAPTSGKTDECIQLFLNLMENGIKLSPSGSTLDVSLERLPSWTGRAFPESLRNRTNLRRIVNLAPTVKPVWRVIISDSGPGFRKNHLPRIGERFYRVAGDLPAQEKGTGLGLAIVKHIVMRHRAGLFVRSKHADESENKIHGTSFCVIFPVTEPEPPLH